MADEKAPPTHRRCVAPLRRTVTGGAPLRVRHRDGRLTVTPRRRRSEPPPRPGRAAAGAVTVLLVLLAALATMLSGIRPGGRETAGACPDRTSSVVEAAGHTLRFRLERGAVAMLHLCADPGTASVVAWDVAVTDASGATVAVPVLAVGERLALAAAQLPEESPFLTVNLSFATGSTATFGIRV